MKNRELFDKSVYFYMCPIGTTFRLEGYTAFYHKVSNTHYRAVHGYPYEGRTTYDSTMRIIPLSSFRSDLFILKDFR